jgi:hypothetical protein
MKVNYWIAFGIALGMLLNGGLPEVDINTVLTILPW